MPPHLLYGVVRLPLWGYAALTFALVQLMLLGVTLYLHRDQSHGGLILHPLLRHFFRFWLWFCSGTVTRQWVALHRRHYAFADVTAREDSRDPTATRAFSLDGAAPPRSQAIVRAEGARHRGEFRYWVRRGGRPRSGRSRRDGQLCGGR